MTFNCGGVIGEHRKDRLKRLLQRHRPQIVFLQDLKVVDDQMLVDVNYVIVSSQRPMQRRIPQLFHAEDDEEEIESWIGRTAIALPVGSRYKLHGFSGGGVRDCFGTFVEVMLDGKLALLGSIYLLPAIRSPKLFFAKLKRAVQENLL